jgi:aminopeptidase N
MENLPAAALASILFVAELSACAARPAAAPEKVFAVCAGPVPETAGPTAGSPGIGDPYYPELGNGGYEVQHYALDLALDMDTGRLAGTVALTANALQDLSSFDLDLRGLDVESVRVHAKPAAFERDGDELVITPDAPIPDGTSFDVEIRYAGVPELVPDPALPFLPGVGWFRGPSGVYVLSEVVGAHGWFPCNDHPRDKATFELRVTVSEPYVVAANGPLVEETADAGRRTFVFRPRDPMATYLVTVDVARFGVKEATTAADLPLRLYHPLDASEAELAAFARTGEMLAFFEERFGPYPFECYGAVLSYEPLPGALETQTIPVYGRGADEGTVAHELAHQWFGNSVSTTAWKDLWLNEGFATFAEFLWFEHVEGKAAAEARQRESYARLRERRVGPPADPGVERLFSSRIYARGAWVLHELRREVGDETLFAILRGWTAAHRYGNAGTTDFVALASSVAGRDLGAFFQGVLLDPVIPRVDAYEAAPDAAVPAGS